MNVAPTGQLRIPWGLGQTLTYARQPGWCDRIVQLAYGKATLGLLQIAPGASLVLAAPRIGGEVDCTPPTSVVARVRLSPAGLLTCRVFSSAITELYSLLCKKGMSL